jgi:hypothetical protein
MRPLLKEERVKAILFGWGYFDYWRKTGHWPDFCFEPDPQLDCRAEADRLIAARDKATDQ